MESKKLFDLANLEEMLGGDKEAVFQMVKIFLQATPESLSELVRSYEKNDMNGVSKLAHKLKSSIDIFCVDEIKTDIRKLENNTREQINMDEVPGLVEKIDSILSNAIDQVKEEKIRLGDMLYKNESAG
jgi:HPt (histidine-containing phosphotransfer) domain-containing protein